MHLSALMEAYYDASDIWSNMEWFDVSDKEPWHWERIKLFFRDIRHAQEAADRAVEYYRRGLINDSCISIAEACSIESKYGDCSIWKPVQNLVERAILSLCME